MSSSQVEVHIAHLESQLRRLTLINRVTLATGAVVIATSVVGLQEERSLELKVVDSSGRTRIVATADPFPRLVFKDADGRDQICLGLGGEEHTLPSGHKEAPHLVLGAGETSIRLFLDKVKEGQEGTLLTDSANVQLLGSRTVNGKMELKSANLSISSSQATFGVSTFDPMRPVESVIDPEVKLFIDKAGNVTTKMGKEQR